MLFRRFMEYETQDIALLEKDQMITSRPDTTAINSLSF